MYSEGFRVERESVAVYSRPFASTKASIEDVGCWVLGAGAGCWENRDSLDQRWERKSVELVLIWRDGK